MANITYPYSSLMAVQHLNYKKKKRKEKKRVKERTKTKTNKVKGISNITNTTTSAQAKSEGRHNPEKKAPKSSTRIFQNLATVNLSTLCRNCHKHISSRIL